MILDSFLEGVRRTTLPNGLTLLTSEKKGSGVVAINTWVKAGYFHEPDEVAGMAHLFEHMFFKGSKNFPGAEDIAKHVSMLGGTSNAGTIYDSTNYYFILPNEGFVRGVEIQADAIANPLFEPDELVKEAEVVIEESNRKLDNPPALATERMFATAFTKHRMKRWRIGSNEVLRNINRDDLLAFFETLYRPENIIVAICGDVPYEEILDVVTRTFGSLPRGTLKKERGPTEPEQEAFRFAESTGDIQQSWSIMGWHVPGNGAEDSEALDLLSAVLAGGRYSRLYRDVVSQGAANTISATNLAYEDVGIFTIRASADDERLEETERLTIGEIERVRRFGPTLFELELARNSAESSFVFELDDVLGQSQTLAWFEARSQYEELGLYLEKLKSVSAEDVKRVANTYLVPDNMTLYRYRKTGAPSGDRDTILEELAEAATSISGEGLPEIEPPTLPASPQGATAELPANQFALSNGITLFVREIPGTPTVSTGVYIRGGRVHENTSNAGITQLMARAMKRGTKNRSMEDIDREIEFLGTQIGVLLDDDYFGISVDILRHHYGAGLDILADVIRNPVFPEDDVDRARRLQIASIQRSLDSTSQRPFQLLRSAFFRNHPYGMPDSGFVSSVETLTREQLIDWHSKHVTADVMTIVVVGDVDARDICDMMEQTFGSVPISESPHPPIPSFEPITVRTEISEQREKKQSGIAVGFPTVPPTHPDWIPLRFLQDVCSGLAGTLFAELRSKRALAYTVYAGDASQMRTGTFVGYIATEAVKEVEARDALLAEIARLSVDGFGHDDVQRARSHLAGTTRIKLQSNSAKRAEIAMNHLYNLGTDFTQRFLERVHEVTLEELREVAGKYLASDAFVVATLKGRP